MKGAAIMYRRYPYPGKRRWKRRRRKSLMDILFTASTAAAGILSVLAVLLAVRPEFPGIDRLIGNSMVSEGATGKKGGNDGFMVYPVPLAGDVLQIVTGYLYQAGNPGSVLKPDITQAVPGVPSVPAPLSASGNTNTPDTLSTPDGSTTLDSSITPDTPSVPDDVLPQKVMYLTFDDGPSEENTNAVLDVLKNRNIKATFFVVGENVLKHPETAQRIVAEGHTIGIHCYRHDYEALYESVDSYLEDFDKAYRAVLEVTGEKARLYRFPGGSINSHNREVYSDIIAAMDARGFIYFDWNASLDDALRKSSPEELLDNAKKTMMGRRKVVLLGHDIVHSTSLCLDQLISQFQEYSMEPLTPEVEPVRFRP